MLIEVKWTTGNGENKRWHGEKSDVPSVIRMAAQEAQDGPFAGLYTGNLPAMPLPQNENNPVLVPDLEEVPF